MFTAVSQRLHDRSVALLLGLESGLDRIMIYWLAIAGLASAARIALSPMQHGAMGVVTLLPFILLVLAPMASMILALRLFADGPRMPQPQFRLARIGGWRNIGSDEAARHPLYGPRGIMVSLLIGMLINVPVRAAEYLTTMPAITGAAPHWLAVLHTMMTLDVVLLTSLYAIAFVAALRCVPLFPRLLVAIWAIDLVMQLMVAQIAVGAGLPSTVAAPLESLLVGNVKKVLISVCLWLPYLLLSTRVNVTYRQRLPL